MTMKPKEKKTISEPRFSCDGGGGAMGHPKIYLTVNEDGFVDCPYCGCHFQLKK